MDSGERENSRVAGWRRDSAVIGAFPSGDGGYIRGLMSRHLLFLLISGTFACVSSAAAAVVNIEGMRKGLEAAPGWSGSLKLDLGGSSGNSEKFNAALGMLAQHRRDGAVNLIAFSYDYGETAGARNTDKQTLHLRHTEEWRERLDWEAFGQWQRNDFTRLTRRLLAGGGLRWDLLEPGRKQSGERFYLGTGLFAETQTFRSAPGKDTVRANLYLSAVRPVFAASSLSGSVYFQPSFEDPGDHRAVGSLAFSVPMREDLALEISLNCAYDSQPPAGVKRTDIEYRTGIRWSF